MRALAALVFGTTIVCLAAPALNGADEREGASDARGAAASPAELALFRQVLGIIAHDYVDTTNRQQLIERALRGMASGLDPYSAFLDTGELEDLEAEDEGTYCGVGIDFETVGSAVEIVSVMDNSSAARAGLRRGDAIVAVEGRAVEAGSTETMALMRGAAGSDLHLAVRHATNELGVYSLRRSCQPMPSVSATLMEPGYGRVQISTFSDSTPGELIRAIHELDRLNHADLSGLVLDLRCNGGGVLDDGTAVADAFLDRGVIVTADGRTREAHMYVEATPGDLLHGAPLAVLVNGGSASAAEIVAGALRDHARATLVGSRTYGKGLIQSIVPLSKGAIKLTTARFFTPSGASIQGTGIVPDVLVGDRGECDAPPAPEQARTLAVDDDPAIRAALGILKQRAIRIAEPVTASSVEP